VVYIYHTSLAKLVHHADFELRITFQLWVPALFLNEFVDRKGLLHVLVARASVVQKVSNLE
jgi:hypothetical protein